MTMTMSYSQWRYERTCAGKTAYPSVGAATRGITKATRLNGGHFQAYQCDFCAEFHIGHGRRRGAIAPG